MGKGFLAVIGLVFCLVLAGSVFGECFLTVGEGDLGCDGLPLYSCGQASLPSENGVFDIYCSQEYSIDMSYLSAPSPSLIYSVFVELA